MDDALKQLFHLVKCVINKEPKTVERITDEEGLLELSRANSFSGMIFSLLKKSEMKTEIYTKFQNAFFQFYSRDIKQLAAIEKINELFNDNKINHIFLKGSELKKIYPESYMRSMGDIDILVKESDMIKVHEVLETNGFRNTINDDNHDCFSLGKNSEVEIEVHPKLNSEFDSKYNQLFTHVWENTVLVDKYRYEFTKTYFLIYLLYHMAKHFQSSGVGLRSVLDIGLFIRNYQEDINKEELNKWFKLIPIKQFFTNILLLNKIYFEIEEVGIFLDDKIEVDNDFLEEVIQYIAKAGVHGYGKDFNQHTARLASKKQKAKSVIGTRINNYIKIIFPSRNVLKNSYPFLSKYWIFLPIAWVKRWFKLLFKERKASKIKLKQLNSVKNEDILNVSMMYEKMGL